MGGVEPFPEPWGVAEFSQALVDPRQARHGLQVQETDYLDEQLVPEREKHVPVPARASLSLRKREST